MRVVIVDDEPLARRRLRRLLGPEADVEIVAEAGDGRSAVRTIMTAKPDVVLLDVQMPGPDGIEVARRLPAPRPVIVFVTAFDHYAVQAFELRAIDYLLKPVTRDRLAESMARVREQFRDRAATDRALSALLDQFATPARWLERVPVRSAGRIDLVDVAAVDWIEAANNYVVLHAGRDAHILRSTLGELVSSLDPRRFVRIHRSAVVAVDRIARLDSLSRGDYEVVLKSGTRVLMSRTYRSEVERALKIRPV
jgi:two-component system LytT family response regulator